MSKLEHKIEAHHLNLFEVLNEQKYTVDYFQREYSWGKKHIEALVTDLTSAFLNEYTPGDKRDQGENYNNYYLGPFVVSSKDGKRSIIDGQQRLTSLTLFLCGQARRAHETGSRRTLPRAGGAPARGLDIAECHSGVLIAFSASWL